jgi:hypothetical protein
MKIATQTAARANDKICDAHFRLLGIALAVCMQGMVRTSHNFFAKVARFVCMMIENSAISAYHRNKATARQATSLGVANTVYPRLIFA